VSLVFSNKIVMKFYSFEYPVFLTWAQLVIAEMFILLFGVLNVFVGGWFSVFPLEWDWNIAFQILPLTFVWLGMMITSNICLRYTEVTFYQVVRSLTIIWSLILHMWQFPEIVIGNNTIVACIIVSLGFAVGSFGEINFNWMGFLFGILSSVMVAFYNNQIKKSLVYVDKSSWRLMIYNTTLAIPISFPLVFATDRSVFEELPNMSFELMLGITFCGILGLVINVAIFLQVNLTSPLTGTISGTVKGILQVALGWLLFRNEISNVNAVGIVLVMVGSWYYSWIGYQALRNKEENKKN